MREKKAANPNSWMSFWDFWHILLEKLQTINYQSSCSSITFNYLTALLAARIDTFLLFVM